MKFLARHIIFLLVISVSSAMLNGQTISINEIMSSNVSTIADDFDEYEDWIELYNYGNEPVDLAGYGLSDDPGKPFKWVFPSIVLQPREFLVVWASGRDQKPTDGWRNGIRQHIYKNIPGVHVRELTEHEKYPHYPDETAVLTGGFVAPMNMDDHFGQRLDGYIQAPETGEYIFWISADDSGLLSISRGEDEADLQDIASVPRFINYMEWNRFPEQKSDPVFLEAGRFYYIRALMKEGSGSDHLLVRWQLPSGVIEEPIPANRIFLNESALHTNFSISSQGETITLTRPDGVLADQAEAVKLKPGISYGRRPDGQGSWYFFEQPTPGNSNNTLASRQILAAPVLSSPGGIFMGEMDVEIFHPDPDVTLIYTLDGSEPAVENFEPKTYDYKRGYRKNFDDEEKGTLTRTYQSYRYTAPLRIKDTTGGGSSQTDVATRFETEPTEPRVPPLKGTVVRAMAVKEGAIASESVTATYIIGDDLYSVPVVAITGSEKSFFSWEGGIYVPGKIFDDWRSENWDANADGHSPGNYSMTGDEWEREINFEYFSPRGESLLNQGAGVRIHGGWSRSFPQKSLRIYARNAYGEEEFNHQFFPDKETSTFKRIILRAGGNDHSRTFFRDLLIHRLVRNRPVDSQHGQPAISFLNGEYWGIVNIRDRVDQYYLHYKYGVDPDQVDLLTGNAVTKEGENFHYLNMMDYARNNNLSDSQHYDHLKTLMDVENFAEYYAIQIYINNLDWPQNNIDFWRYRNDSFQPDAPPGHDGRWRWILFDLDFGFGLYGNGPEDNTFDHVTRNQWSRELFRLLIQNRDFRHLLINRFADQMNTVFHPDTVKEKIGEMKQLYEPLMEDHINRWSVISSMREWENQINRMTRFVEERPGHMRNHIRKFFDLKGTVKLTLDVASGKGKIRVNTIEMDNPGEWTGIYYQGVPIEVEAIAGASYRFSHWEGSESGKEALISLTPGGDILLKAHFVKSDEPALLAFWMFDDRLPNDMPLETIDAFWSVTGSDKLIFESALQGYPFTVVHPLWRKASLERRNMPTPINYYPEGNNGVSFEASEMRGIQVKQPFRDNEGENQLVFHVSATDYKDILFSFAAIDEDAAASLVIDYSTEADLWETQDMETSDLALDDSYRLYKIDFKGVNDVNDHPGFRIRIRFEGDNLTEDEGNRVTFNNFALLGKALADDESKPRISEEIGLVEIIEDSEPVRIDLNKVFHDPDQGALTFSGTSSLPDIAGVNVAGSRLEIRPQQRGEAIITLQAANNQDLDATYRFRVVVYPAAFHLADSSFAFTEWSGDHAEFTYPEYMLFIQSDTDDPGMAYPLTYAYHIPRDDYAAEDLATVGFPYNNTSRTRINGLGFRGISMINTGRERDLGGVLVAVNTTGQDSITISWKAATLQRNERLYGIRLQYRTSLDEPFRDVVSGGQLWYYAAGKDGEMRVFSDITIPDDAKNQEYVQFLWRYYHFGGKEGPRSELRLDDIHIGNPRLAIRDDNDPAFIVFPNPASDRIHIYSELQITLIELLTVAGAKVTSYSFTGNEITIPVAGVANGIYLLRVHTEDRAITTTRVKILR
jgi:hypothetical protein